jgi:hypothetical protein
MSDTVEAGGLQFLVENRAGEKDGGPTMRVLANLDGKPVQLLRFDMFRVSPHYHYAPAGGKNLRYDIDPLLLDDGIGWATQLVSTKLAPLLEKAGYPALATPATIAAVKQAMPEIERRWRAQREEAEDSP